MDVDEEPRYDMRDVSPLTQFRESTYRIFPGIIDFETAAPTAAPPSEEEEQPGQPISPMRQGGKHQKSPPPGEPKPKRLLPSRIYQSHGGSSVAGPSRDRDFEAAGGSSRDALPISMRLRVRAPTAILDTQKPSSHGSHGG